MTITPLQRWTRDDWVIPCILQDAAGTAINLTGSIIGAELWLAGYRVFSPLAVANGGIIRVSDVAGQFTVVAPRLVTAGAPADAGTNPAERTRILIYRIDTNGRRQTLAAVPFEVFDGSEDLAIDQIPILTLVSQSTTLQLVVAASQGPAGPSSIPAAQISDSGATGQAIVQAGTAAAVRTLLGVQGNSRHAVADANYLAQASDTYVGFTALTAPRAITLPPADAYPQGQALWIADETGLCSTGTPINILAAGSDTIAGQALVTLASPYGKLALHSNGSNLWTV